MKTFFLICLVLLYSGCSLKQDVSSKDFLQTSSAMQIRKYLKDIDSLLIQYHQKLNLRNPKQSDTKLFSILQHSIHYTSDAIAIANINNSSYVNYIEAAFDKRANIYNRNELLVAGVYKLIYQAYNRADGHNFTALNYDTAKLQEAYKALQVIFWRVKTYRDLNNNYLFLTWQNNWQIELEKRLSNTKEINSELINSLEYIKNQRESIFEPSNMAFAQIESKILYIVEKSINLRGGEALNLGVEALKGIVLLPL